MTRWLEPVQLTLCAWRTLGKKRIDASRDDLHGADLGHPTMAWEGPEHDGADFWFDYVADLGDAFEPTMAVAWQLGRRVLRPVETSQEPRRRFGEVPDDGLPRGKLLVMGGDEVYPYAGRRRYENQTIGPYRAGWEDGSGANAALVALPGNHDYYGGLEPFRDAFCERRAIGGWSTCQDSTWWSLRLPHRWWMWGIDTGLQGMINERQRRYFAEEADVVRRAAGRVIVCVPVPLFRLRESNPEHLAALDSFIAELGVDAPVYLSGDLHVFVTHTRRRYLPSARQGDHTDGSGRVGPEWPARRASRGGGR